MVKPLVKWAGGKRQIITGLKQLLPSKWGTYFEPFAGGAALLCDLYNSDLLKKGVLSDTNASLIGLYRVVKKEPVKLIDELSDIGYSNDRRSYLDARAEFNEKRKRVRESIRTAALFIYLNRHSYNGLWRVNRSGDHNVPFGNYVNPRLPNARHIREFSDMLSKVKILNSDFAKAVMVAEPGDFVYFDPPYCPVSKTANFTTYTPQGFSDSDQVKLLNVCQELDGKDVNFMLSNSDTERIREMFQEFASKTVTARRNINSKGNLRDGFTELVITNYVPESIPG